MESNLYAAITNAHYLTHERASKKWKAFLAGLIISIGDALKYMSAIQGAANQKKVLAGVQYCKKEAGTKSKTPFVFFQFLGKTEWAPDRRSEKPGKEIGVDQVRFKRRRSIDTCANCSEGVECMEE